MSSCLQSVWTQCNKRSETTHGSFKCIWMKLISVVPASAQSDLIQNRKSRAICHLTEGHWGTLCAFVTCDVIPFMNLIAVLSVEWQHWFCWSFFFFFLKKRYFAPCEQLYTEGWPEVNLAQRGGYAARHSPQDPLSFLYTGTRSVSQACSFPEPQPDKGQSLRERCLRAFEQCLW